MDYPFGNPSEFGNDDTLNNTDIRDAISLINYLTNDTSSKNNNIVLEGFDKKNNYTFKDLADIIRGVLT